MGDFKRIDGRHLCKCCLLRLKMATTQGIGITESGDRPTNVLETNVTIISNQECYDLLSKVPFPTHKTTIKSTLFDGVTDQVVCTKGFLENGVVTVSSKSFDKR